ncbi:MAG: CBS domain-containing protein [Bacteroidales bacterium]|nr:CBS domain-containing protein [Bacteroidales bacterium]
MIMNLLDISLLMPAGHLVWAPVAVAAVSLILLFVVSALRHAVHSISDSDARILHHHKTPQEQRIYMFYQRKEKVKAAMSAAETFLALVFVMSMSQLIKGCSVSEATELVDFHDPAWPAFVLYFVMMCFALVIVIIVPGRMMSDAARHSMLLKMGWMVNIVSGMFGVVSFCDSYSQARGDSASGKLTVSIGSEPPKTGEKDMIRNILQFGDIEVREIMTPRHDIVAVDTSDKFSVLKAKIRESNFSRIPVFEDKTDNIFGIIYVKDLIAHIKENDDFAWTSLVRRIKFVSENKKISDLLKEFQQTKNHMAAVTDEYGGISGLITMQDILEKIVGEMSDEFDSDEANLIMKLSDSYYICDGRVMLDDFCRELQLGPDYFDDVKGDAESLAGVLLEIRGEFPPVHEKIQCKNLTLAVESFTGRRIEKISVRL